MRTPLPVGTHLTLSAIGTQHQITVQIQELIGTGASCLVYTAVCRGRGTKRILSPAERVLSGKSTPDSAAGRQFACSRRRSFSAADARLYLGVSKADAVPAVPGELQQYQQCPGRFCRKRHPVYCYELSEQHSAGTAGVVAL